MLLLLSTNKQVSHQIALELFRYTDPSLSFSLRYGLLMNWVGMCVLIRDEEVRQGKDKEKLWVGG